MLFLFSTDIIVVSTFALRGLLSIDFLVLGLVCSVPLAAGAMLGQRLFNPEKAALFRMVAYTLIAIAATVGLPLFD